MAESDLPHSEKGKGRFTVIEGASQRGKPLLVDNIGYKYNINKTRKNGNVSWTCPVRNKVAKCPASVRQSGDQFLPNHRPHNHPKEPDLELKARIAAEVKVRVSEDCVMPAPEIVENVLLSQDTSKVHVLPDPELIIRQVKRKLQKVKMMESKDVSSVKQSSRQFRKCPQIQYSVIEGASQRGKPLLIDSIGYKYNIGKIRSGKVYWSCAQRKNHARCHVRVVQEGDSFTLNEMSHNHIAEPGTALKARIVAKAKEKALEDNVRTARDIFKDVVYCLNADKDKVLPAPSLIIRQINRKRQKLRESKTKDHDDDMVDVDACVLPQDLVQCEESGVVQYSVIKEDSKRGKSLLVDSIGYKYNIKRSYPSGKVLWKCNVRNEYVICPATVQQNGDEFIPSQICHNHSAQSDIESNDRVAAKVKEKASEDIVTSAKKISTAKVLSDSNSIIRQDFRKHQEAKQLESENHKLTMSVVNSTLHPPAKQDREIPAVSYSVMEGASRHGNSLLLDTNGHTYCIHSILSAGKVLWRCTVRNKKVMCKASVLQSLDSFKPSQKKHSHFPPLGTDLNI